MKVFVLGLLIGLSVWTQALTAKSLTTSNVDKSGVILEGYDAVSYFKSDKPQKGDAKFKYDFNGATYYFATEENKNEFLKKPSQYAPQYGGWCAFAVADSKSKVEIDPTSFLIQDGKLLVFYKGIWGDTRKKWSKDPKTLLNTAEANWPDVEKKEP